MYKEMNRFLFQQDQVKLQIVQNLIEAGSMKPDLEQIVANLDVLDKLDPKDLLTVLLESHNLREEAIPGIPISYPIDVRNIGRN